jgi:hypothetical protein
MTSSADSQAFEATRPEPRRHRVRHPAAVLILVLTAIGIGIASALGYWLWSQQSVASNPACSWPMRVEGNADRQQIGLVHCYLQDLASNNADGMAGLMAVTNQGAKITRRDLAHATDARSGLSSASFHQNPVDSANASVTITFADGATWEGDIYNMDAFAPQGSFNFSDQGPNEWRMAIGSDWS